MTGQAWSLNKNPLLCEMLCVVPNAPDCPRESLHDETTNAVRTFRAERSPFFANVHFPPPCRTSSTYLSTSLSATWTLVQLRGLCGIRTGMPLSAFTYSANCPLSQVRSMRQDQWPPVYPAWPVAPRRTRSSRHCRYSTSSVESKPEHPRTWQSCLSTACLQQRHPRR